MLKALEGEDVRQQMPFDYNDAKIPSIYDIEPAPSQIRLTQLNVVIMTIVHGSPRVDPFGAPGEMPARLRAFVAACLSQMYVRSDGTHSKIWDCSDVESLPRDQLHSGDCLCTQEFREKLHVGTIARGHSIS